MEIVQERLESEYDMDVIVTAPSVAYKVVLKKKNEELLITNPSHLPESRDYSAIKEPYALVEIISPSEYTGTVMELCQSRRGKLIEVKTFTISGNSSRVGLYYDIPLSEVITTFSDSLKSRTKGYASMSYTEQDYRESDLVRLDIKLNDELVLPLSSIVHSSRAVETGKLLCEKLKESIPQELFKISIQACIGARVIASSQISQLQKDVTAKLYGGDISRKKKLWEKQARGKKRMRAVGKIHIPQDAFVAILKSNSD
jgi:GTP-binding protein LepA